MDEMLSGARQVLAAQPFSVLLNAEVSAFAPGMAEMLVPITDQMTQHHGTVHGGVIAFAADNALTFAGGSVLGTAVMTAEFKINFVAPGRGERLRARATVLSQGKRRAVVQCEVFAEHGDKTTLIAVALGTIVSFESAAS